MKVAVFICAMMFAGAVWAQDCSLKQLASLPMTTLPDGEIAVPVKINGKDHLFGVTTVGPLPAISEDIVTQERMDTTQLPNGGYVAFNSPFVDGGTSRATALASMHLQIGNWDAPSAQMAVIPGWKGTSGVDGVIASSLLVNFDVEFDFKSARLNLYSPDHCPGKVVFWANEYATAPLAQTPNGMTITQVALDGKVVNAGLDLGPTTAHLELDVASVLTGVPAGALRATKIEPREGLSNGAWRYPFKALSIGGIAIENPQINLIDGEFCKVPNTQWPPETGTLMKNLCAADLWLGQDELRKLHLYLSFKENKLYATAADAHK